MRFANGYLKIRDGIYFSELAPRVRTVFVMAGTRDQHDFHLYVLSAIARTVQRSGFQERWFKSEEYGVHPPSAREEAVLTHFPLDSKSAD